MTFWCQIQRLGQGHALRDRGYSYFIFKYPIPFSKAIPITGIEPGRVTRYTHIQKERNKQNGAFFVVVDGTMRRSDCSGGKNEILIWCIEKCQQLGLKTHQAFKKLQFLASELGNANTSHQVLGGLNTNAFCILGRQSEL